MKKKHITVVSVAAIITVVAGGWAFAEKVSCSINDNIRRIVNEEYDRRPEFDALKRIENDIQEIRLIFGIMNKDNPEYKKALEVIEKSKAKK